MTSLDSIAASMSQSVDFVRNDLSKMIAKGFFKNATIDFNENKIINQPPAPENASPYAPQPWQSAQQSAMMEVFSCKSCGARGAKQKGMICSCEYCGSAIV
jgi:DNA-directed RNA polymerase subunit RPC12/RpoP